MTGQPAGVSVLIPVRNAEAYLGETLDSVVRQTAVPREVLVVDDGSTDTSRAIAERYGARVTVVDNVGRGASAARTLAGRLARGAYLQFLDADDLLRPDALERRVTALEQSGADLAISDWQRLERRDGRWVSGRIESGDLASRTPPWDLRVFEGFWAPPAAVLYRREACERVGVWHEGLPVIQDARFLMDILRAGSRPAHVAGVGADYRQHTDGSLSTSNPVGFWRDVFANARELETMWRAAGRLDPEHRRALADVYGICARVAVGRDRQLFADSCGALRPFAQDHPSRFGRAAAWLSEWCGVGVARTVLRVAYRPQARRPQ